MTRPNRLSQQLATIAPSQTHVIDFNMTSTHRQNAEERSIVDGSIAVLAVRCSPPRAHGNVELDVSTFSADSPDFTACFSIAYQHARLS